MRKTPFIISGIGLLTIWPFAVWMTAFLFDNPNASRFVEVKRGAVAVTVFAIPLIWTVSFFVAFIVSRRAKTQRALAVATIQETKLNDAQLLRAVATEDIAREKREKLLRACAWAPYIAAGFYVAAVIFLFATG